MTATTPTKRARRTDRQDESSCSKRTIRQPKRQSEATIKQSYEIDSRLEQELNQYADAVSAMQTTTAQKYGQQRHPPSKASFNELMTTLEETAKVLYRLP